MDVFSQVQSRWNSRQTQDQVSCKRVHLDVQVDYFETFSLVAKLNTVRVLLFVVVIKDLPLYQLDVKHMLVFLNGDLKEEVYIEPSSKLKSPV